MNTQPLQQSNAWKEFQKSLHHQMIEVDTHKVRIQPLFFGKSYGYIACGPHIKESKEEVFSKILKSAANKNNLIFTRVDHTAHLDQYFSSQSSHSSYPETTLTVDLKLSDNELLAQMKRKGRYNISLAEKRGVLVMRANTQKKRKTYAQHFHNLLLQTTLRDGFFAHDLSYYKKMLNHLPMAEIFIAFFDDVPISGAICTYHKGVATYFYGASSNQFRELMSPYLVQWEAMKFGKEKNCHTYDFLGIAPENAGIDHPWKGITSFKKKFGGTVVSSLSSTDLIHQAGWYRVFLVAKGIQKIWLKVKRLLRK
ncbi:MAG: peptidoglycan bridge formation glycyltransferase FemA/FemB family protein [Candidatus Gracilibacteria bacterium]|nr:peptidoglycan bridge formation glycyltransferase FemA/FemB family protein [Candidatus Gracilibacteria bacterium]